MVCRVQHPDGDHRFGHWLTLTLIRPADILNYALTLEHLEDKFYREGLANFTESDFAAAGYNSTFYANLKEISSDETTHVSFLTKALTGQLECPSRFNRKVH